MNKVLSVAALLALATASEDFTDFELNLLSKIKDDVKKAGHFVVEHPQIITTAAKILARDDEIVDDELNAKDVLKKIGKGLLTGAKIASKFLDNEMTENELNVFSHIKDDLKKAGHFVAEHPEIVKTAIKLLKDDEVADEELLLRLQPLVDRRLNFPVHIADDELIHLPKPKIGVHVGFDDMVDDELNIFSKIKEKAKKAVNWVGDHPQVISEAAKAAKILKKDDEVADDELIHLPKPKVGVHIGFDEMADDELNAKDVFKKIGKGLLTGAKIASKFLDDEAADDELIHLPKPKVGVHIGFDEMVDDELNAKDVFKKIGKGLLTGAKIASKFLDDEAAENELNVFSHIKDDLKKAANWVGDHPQVISEAAKAAKLLKKDDEVADDELIHLPKPKIDVHIGFDDMADDELSNLGVLLHEGRHIQKNHQRNHTIAKPIKKISEVHDHNLSIKDKLKKAAGWVGDHPQVISEAAKAAKLLRGKH